MHQRLKKVEDLKNSLIDAFDAVSKARPAYEVAILREQVSQCEANWRQCQESLRYWQEVIDKNRTGATNVLSALRGTLARALHLEAEPSPNNPTRDVQIINMYKRMDEDIPDDVVTLERLLDCKNTQFEQGGQALVEARIDYRFALKEQEEAKAAKKAFVNMAKEAIDLGLVSADQYRQITTAENFHQLDQVLDTTFRFAEFWLAIHYYEADWLLYVRENQIIESGKRRQNTKSVMEPYWRQAAALTPCFVMTVYKLPKFFKIFDPNVNEKNTYDYERADLLIVDEAGQVETTLGASSFAFAKRAVVVGDVKQLPPIWEVDAVTDKEIAQSHRKLTDAHWEEMCVRGLTASAASSLMRAATCASNWISAESPAKDAAISPSIANKMGLMLVEHFRCHEQIISFCNELIYENKLIPSRSGADHEPLRRHFESPFMFLMTPDTKSMRSGSSLVNSGEAQIIVQWIVKNAAILENSCGCKLGKAVVVVTPYKAQASLILRELRRRGISGVKVGTAHSLQGAEYPVVLYSSVCGSNVLQSSFVETMPELMNVAVSRAKDLFVVFGCKARWDDSGAISKLIKRHATLGKIEK